MKKHSFTLFSRRIFARPWKRKIPLHFILGGITGSLVISFYGGSRLAGALGAVNALLLCSAAALIFFGAILAFAPAPGSFCSKAGFRKVRFQDLLLCFLALAILLPVSALLTGSWQQILEFFHISYEKEQSFIFLVRQGGKGTYFQLLLLTAAVVPCLEELIFRRGLYALLGKLGAPAAMVGTAFIFSIAHGFVLGIPALFFIGLTFQAVCNITRNLWCSIITHALLNAMVLSITFLASKYASA